MSDTGNDLRTRRLALGLTQTELAEALDPPSTQAMISRYESGERRIPVGLWQAMETIEREHDGRTAPAGGS